MYIQSRAASIAFKAVLIAAGIWGLLLTFGVFEGRFNLGMLNYYTVLSNLLCVVYFLLDLAYLIRHRHDPTKTTWRPLLKGIVTMGITVTMLVAHFMLGMRFSMGNSSGLSLLLVHYIVPAMTILDWLLFDPKGRIKKTAPLVWTAAPLVYFVYTLIAVQAGMTMGQDSKYPYPFLDTDTLGWGHVLLTVLILAVFFIALGYLFFVADRILSKAGEKKKSIPMDEKTGLPQ